MSDVFDPEMFGTEGIDAYVTPDRIILLDAEPIMSSAFFNGRFEDEVENEAELLSLQYTALLMSICHILIVVQDYTFDPHLLRYSHWIILILFYSLFSILSWIRIKEVWS